MFRRGRDHDGRGSAFSGDEVTVAEGAFSGMRAFVLRVMPARRRVQVLLDVLGRPTPAELDENSVVVEGNGVANLVPMLAAPALQNSTVLS